MRSCAKALVKAGRSDLIGYGADCLVPPEGRTADGARMRGARMRGARMRLKSKNAKQQ